MTGSYGGVAGDDAANIRAEAVVAGTDLWLDGTAGNKLDWMAGSENNATVALALREACHRILYNVLHSNAMNGMDSSTRIDPITVWWQYALMAAQIAVGVLTAISLAMAIISFVLAARKKKAVALSPVKASVGASVKTDTGKGNYVRDEIGSDGENGGQGGPEDEPPVKKSWFARHRKLLVLIGSIVIAVIVIVAIVVPVTTCGGATAPAPDGGGNDENPSVQTHVCEHKCPVCGGCIDLECDDPVCATKCGEGRQPHVYEAENAARTFGDNGYMSRLTEGETTSLTNVYGNRNATLTFTVEASEDVTASLSVTMTGYVKTTDFSDVLSVSVKNGEKSSVMTTTAEVPRNGAGTAGFNEVMLGCVQLGAGENTITFTVVNSVNLTLSDNGYDNGFDIDKITLYGDSLSADAHVCTMVCPDCGGCLDADCGDEACAEKCGDDKSATYVFEAEDATFGAGTGGTPRVESNGDFVGNFSENAGATITFAFNAESAGKGTLIVGASYRNVERAFTDGFNVYVNDPEKTSPMSSPAAVPGSRSVGGDWNIWDQSARVILGCIDIAEGENTVVLEVKSDNTNTAFNLDYIRIATDVALPGAEVDGPEPEPGVHVCESECPVCGKCTDMTCEDPVCAEKCGDALEQTVRFEAENARLTDGAKGGVKVESNGKYVGGLSENRGAKVTFTFNVTGGSEGDLTATLYAGSTYRSTDISFTDGFNVYVNGNLIENRASKVPSSASIGRTGNVWDVTFMVNLGCIELVDGVNTIELEVASSDASTTTNLDCIELRCSSALTAGSVSE